MQHFYTIQKIFSVKGYESNFWNDPWWLKIIGVCPYNKQRIYEDSRDRASLIKFLLKTLTKIYISII